MNNSDLCNLHVHDEFSLLDGAMRNSDLVKAIAKWKQPALATTNHGNVDGVLRHQKACKEAGLKAIVGCELYMIDPTAIPRLETTRAERYHLTALCKTMDGFRKLMRGLTVGNELMRGHQRNDRPLVPMDLPLKEGWAGDILLLSGCASSPFWKPEMRKWLPSYVEAFRDDLYAEIMPLHDFGPQLEINRSALDASRKYNLKPAATNDAHYIGADCCENHEVLLAVGTRHYMSDPDRFKFDSKLNYLRTPSEMVASFLSMGLPKDVATRAVLNTREIADKCPFQMKTLPVELPEVLPKGTNEAQWMLDRCAAVLKDKGRWEDPAYQERLEKELQAIVSGGFTRYILLVAEVVNWARESGIMVGPGRGSVAGSLVCYLLGITQVDPLPHDLVFERFISEGRIDLPDIDLDFEDRKRWMIDQHLAEKYGANNVAKLSTFALLRGKQAIKDVSRVYEVPIKDSQEMSNAIIIRPAADSRASFGILDTVEMFDVGRKFNQKYPHVVKHAAMLEGQVKNVGIHAAGRVVSSYDLRSGRNCVLVKRGRGKNREVVVNWDKKDLEQMGLMKLDVLGLATLSVLDECKKLVKERHGKDIVWTEIDLSDKKVYDDCISKGMTATCFQIGSRGLQKLSVQLKTDNFRTLVDSSALWRPGCLKSGITGRYVEFHTGSEQPTYLNKVHKEICQATYGQVLYQEQIMYFMYRLAGIPWKTADSVRKIVSKKQGESEWQKYEKIFSDGCVERKTLTREQAVKLWNDLKFFGQYSFNLSHAVAYSMMSFWTAWAKTYYPAEYLASYLNYGAVEGKEGASQVTKLDEALREAVRLGLKISRPDVNRSDFNWTIHGTNELVAGLGEIKGISEDTAKELIRAREKAGGRIRSVEELVSNVERRRVHKGVIEKLINSGAFDAVDLDRSKLWTLHFERLYPQVLTRKLAEMVDSLRPKLEEDWAMKEAELTDQRNLSLRYTPEFGGGTFGRFRKFLRSYFTIVDIKAMEKAHPDQAVYLCGLATSIKYGYRENVKMVQRKGPTEQAGTKEAMGGVYGIFDDGTGFMMAVYNPELYLRRKATIEQLAGKSILIKARYVAYKQNLFVEDVWTLEELSKAKFRGLELRAMGASRNGRDWGAFRQEIHACRQCDLRNGCERPTAFSHGKLKAAIVGEAPGASEEKEGKGFVGKSGWALWNELSRHGLKRDHFMVANTVACRPPGNKLPNVTYVNKCPWLTKAIAKEKPLAILALGASAMYYFNGQPKGISALNGTTQWVPKASAWVTYCLHPASTLYDPANKEAFRAGVDEFARVLGALS